jgi:hypothetical protein
MGDFSFLSLFTYGIYTILLNNIFFIFFLSIIMKKYTKEQINKKYAWKYIDVYSTVDCTTRQKLYEVRKVYKEIHENTTLWEDVGTSMEYRR